MYVLLPNSVPLVCNPLSQADIQGFLLCVVT